MEKNHRALDTGGAGRDVKIGSDLGLEWFQAQPKWEIPDKTSVRLLPCLAVSSVGSLKTRDSSHECANQYLETPK